MLAREGISLFARAWRSFGRVGIRGEVGAPKLMVLPGFLSTDRTTLGLQRAFANAGYRVSGWGPGLNTGVRAETLERVLARIARFGAGEKVILVGWSLGGLYAREAAKQAPELVEKVITLGTPFSGDMRSNNAWPLYQLVAGHKVDKPPVDTDPSEKPPVPTLAIWSRKDGVIAPAAARGKPGERDAELELDCTHMGFGVSARAYPEIVAAVRGFAAG
jgi:pimeloyl-ACP methyl ester carboxylesterase